MRIEPTEPTITIFEALDEDAYLERALPSNDVIGFKVLNYTRRGAEAIKTIIGAVVDTIFEPETQPPARRGPAKLMTRALLRRFDWQRLARLAA